MGRKPKQRQPRTKIFPGFDDRFHAFVPVGLKRNGETDRRHRGSADYEDLVRKVLELEDQVERDEVPHIGKSPTFENWLNEWVGEIAPLTARYKALANYRSQISNYLIPYLGQWRLSQLTKRHFAELYRDLTVKERLAASSVHTVHRVACAALTKALDFEVVGLNSNPASAASSALPKIPDDDVEPLTPAEVSRVLTAAAGRRNHVRWWLAFMGPRQGEALGLKWGDIDWEGRFAQIRRQLQRQTYQHGCGNPQACASAHCVTGGCGLDCRSRVWEHGCADARKCASQHCKRPRKQPCPPDCTGHARGCPERRKSQCRIQWHRTGCAPDCTDHAKACPQRVGGLVLTEVEVEQPTESRRERSRRGRKSERDLRPKTAAGNRRLPLHQLLLAEFLDHKIRQDAERERAGDAWRGMDLVFTDMLGGPIDPRTDLEEWGEILDEASVDYIELHGARKTAATIAGGENLDPVVRNAVMGWESLEMAARYQSVPLELLLRAGDAIGDAVYGDFATSVATTGKNAAGSDLIET